MRTRISFFIVLFTACVGTSAAFAQKFNLLIGTYTSPGGSEGIYVYEFDAATGKLTYRSKAAGVNPSFVAIARDQKHVYAVSEADKVNGGIAAFDWDAGSGTLKFLNKQSAGGDGTCYVSVDATGKFVFAANYGSGSIAAIPVKADGSLGSEIQAIAYTGGGPDKSRQEKAHLHCVVLSPDNKYLFANDLGSDKTYIHQVDLSKPSSPLTPSNPAYLTVKPASGPRHITFHPNQKFAYLALEMEGAVNALSYKDGKLAVIQSESLLAGGFKGAVGAADIHVSPDGKFLYVSNRGDANDISIFSINDKNGRITFAGRQSTLGKTPRNFAIDPTGKYLLAANQNSNSVIVFKRNAKTGLLTDTGIKAEVSKPVCLVFGNR
ncbi:lactonase family protein [Hufsiella ginkgonis]|uniref:Beta-propeller fold lactonase family protein n=1 Tax=Hufsiella ginkgonis TaxID=2695274 RepID=A0A7K1Y369_9SPHI|nr:lactonase family protein [Hufsiella ginkgonis]MXV17327.1 beta-propeller fold lactonase family protein [Hufsiella ginkgonis]